MKTDAVDAYYERVSSKSRDTRSQHADMQAHAANSPNAVWYRDKFTDKTLSRPGWEQLWADVLAGKVKRIVIWGLDRLGRTVSGLSRLFEELQQRGVSLVSIRDGLLLAIGTLGVIGWAWRRRYGTKAA